MKKFICILLSIVFILTLGGCGTSSRDNQATASNNRPSTNSEPTNGDELKLEAVCNWEGDGVLKILSIGNSFSINTLQYAAEIAKSLGIEKIYFGNLYMDGCYLKQHAENAKADASTYRYYTNSGSGWSFVENHKMSDALKEQDWDIITMQQASYFSGKEDSYGDLPYLTQYVKDIVGGRPVLVWNMTWAYEDGYSSLEAYGKKQSIMYKKIIRAVDSQIKTNKNFAEVVSTGTAIQNARTSFMGDKFAKDGMHLNPLGEYIVGLTFVHKLTGLSIYNVEFAPAGVNDRQKKMAIEAAINAVKTPFDITEATDK